jgi:hypothetical protein
MSRRWFTRWIQGKRRGGRAHLRRPARSRPLGFETVESRDLLAAITLPPVADNTLFQARPGNSDGAGPDLYAGETVSDGARRALLKFDVAGNLPAGAHIDSATLLLHVSMDRTSSVSLSVHSLKASWGEGTSNSSEPGGKGVPATTNDATWTDRFFGASPAQKWASAGGDFNSPASATTPAATRINNELFYQWSSVGLVADVQNWLNTPSSQFGWLIKGSSEATGGTAQRLDSRESLTQGFRPQLTINFTLPNTPPTLGAIADPPAILEGATAQTINLTNITAGAGDSQALRVTVASDNTSLIPTPSVTYTPNNSNGSIIYTPVADHFGSAKITVTVRDAGADGIFDNSDDATVSQSFTVNVTAVNDPPTLIAISDPAAILEDAALQTVNLSGISAGPFESQTITITATSDNPSLIPNVSVTYTSPGSSGSLTYKPVADQSGKAVITVTVQDSGGTSNNASDMVVRTFTVNVKPVNDPPTLGTIADPPAVLEDTTEQTLLLTGITAGTSEIGQVLTIKATSNNQGLIADPDVTFNTEDSTATLKYTVAGEQSGVAIITVTVTDDGGTADNGSDTVVRTFAIHVTAVNDPPALQSIDSPTPILENAGQQIVQLNDISAGPSETQVITITAKSDNPTLIPDPKVNYTNPLSAGSLSFTPAAHRSGVANITVTVTDNGGTLNHGVDAITQTFTVVVNEVNDAPTLDAVADPTPIGEDADEQTIPLAGISSGPFESQQLLISTASSNQTLIANVDIHYASPDVTGFLTYTPIGGQSGTTVITVTIRDAGLDGVLNNADDATFARTFNVRVLSPDEINHAPSFSVGTVEPVTDETGAVSLPEFVTNLSAGTPQETQQQTVSFGLSLSIDDQKLFSVQPDVTGAGKLTFTPAPNAHGTAHITIQAKDNGGTAVGGVDTSPTQEFDIGISKLHIWNNTRNARDVNDDHFVVGDDVLTIINYINARGSGKIPATLPIGPPYYDVDNDTFIVAGDVINIINYINAGHGGADGTPPEGEAPLIDPQATAIHPAAADSVFQSFDSNLLALTLTDSSDSLLQPRRK